jgi:hypothetical protein
VSPPGTPSGLALADAIKLIEDAAKGIWTTEGAKALAYLRGRGLNDETIRAARLGWVARVTIPTQGGTRFWRVSGITIPWLDGDRLAMVNIRRLEGTPKYARAFTDRPVIYPTPEAVRPGRPLIIVEGEFDALLLGQALGDLAAVVTLGSASNKPEGATYLAMLAAPVWYLAHDADAAGDKAALGWPARAVRVRPPCFIMPKQSRNTKDWSDLHANGVDLARWWRERLTGTEAPELFTWDELSTWRWGDGSE